MLLCLLARDQAGHFVDEAMAFAPHLVKEIDLSPVLRAKGLPAELDDGPVLAGPSGAKPLVQYQRPRSLEHGIVHDVERPICVRR